MPMGISMKTSSKGCARSSNNPAPPVPPAGYFITVMPVRSPQKGSPKRHVAVWCFSWQRHDDLHANGDTYVVEWYEGRHDNGAQPMPMAIHMLGDGPVI